MWVGGHTNRFISQDSPVVLPCPLKLDRPTESPFPIIEAGQLMPIESLYTHLSYERTKDGNQVAQRHGLVLEHGPLSLYRLAGLGVGRAGFQAGGTQRQNAIALLRELL